MDNSVQISIRLPADMAAALGRVAQANDRTVSGELRHLVRRHVAPKPRLSKVGQQQAGIAGLGTDSAARTH